VNDINDVYITVSAGDNFGLSFIEIEDKGQRMFAIADIDHQNCRFTNKVAVGDLVVTLNGIAVRSSDELNTPDRNVERRLVIRKLRKTGLPPSLPCFNLNTKINTPVLVVKIPVGRMKTKFMNEGGPIVVHQGSQGARMMGIMKKNDIILTVDNILVHGLPTTKVVKLIRRREDSTRTIIILRNIPSPYNNQKPYWNFDGFFIYYESTIEEFRQDNPNMDLVTTIQKMWSAYNELPVVEKNIRCESFKRNRLHLQTVKNGKTAFHYFFKEFLQTRYPNTNIHDAVTTAYNNLSSTDSEIWDKVSQQMNFLKDEMKQKINAKQSGKVTEVSLIENGGPVELADGTVPAKNGGLVPTAINLSPVENDDGMYVIYYFVLFSTLAI
jgi:hypothetical protein